MESLLASSEESTGNSSGRRKSMDPVSQHIRLEELPHPGGRFDLQDLLGTGTCSRVYSAMDKQKGNKVAVKVIDNVAETLLEIESEYRVLSLVGGQSFIPEFHGAYLRSDENGKQQLWFVMELCKGIPVSSLLKWLKTSGRILKEEEISILLKTFMTVLHYLHENDIIHRDVRASNFMLSTEGNVKLIDYGSCAIVKGTEGKALSSLGAPYWMAPEVISCDQMVPYTKSCDVWSLGITAIELAEAEPPLADIHPVRAMFQIARNPPPLLKKVSEWSENLKDFISECLAKNPEHRPYIAELLLHPFITEVDGNMKQQLSLEEHLQQPFNPIIGEKGKHILRGLGKMVEENFQAISSCMNLYLTVKNWHLKTEPDSSYERLWFDDLACLENASEELVIDHLRHRFHQNNIYTFIGDILLSINPRKQLPLYGLKSQVSYREKARSDNPPHVFAVADRAYQQMLHHKRSQVIILMGKCSSGKTYSATQLVNQLAFLGPSNNPGMADKIKQLCPLLDAFGNARTFNNSNASRFLKTISVTFTKTGKITGAILSSMLLEKGRVTSIPMNESNFHILYYMYEGLKSEKRLLEFGLEKLSSFRYLPRLKSENNSSLINGYKTVQRALKALSFTEEEIRTILKVLSVILLLGNLKFKGRGSSVAPSNPDILSSVSKSLCVAQDHLQDAICKVKSVQEAEQKCDLCAQLLYAKLFEWIVAMVNKQLSFSRLVLGDCYSVSVIDPPGFENSQHNELFHLCANTVNDFLQNYIQQLMFLKELEEYKEEGVAIPFHCEESLPHGQLLDSLLDTHQGLLTTIYRASLIAAKGDDSWSEEFRTALKDGFIAIQNDQILVNHILGQVCYNSKDMTFRNINKSPPEFAKILKSSKDPIISAVFTKTNSSSTRMSSDLTQEGSDLVMTQQFQNALSNILEMITEDFPHLIICVQPTCQGDQSDFDQTNIIQQLRSFSIMEMVMIRQQGYARRLSFPEFLNRYKYLAFDFDEEVELSRDNCRLLLIRLKMDGWEIGHNKVFLKYYSEEYLSRLYETHVKKIVKVQALARRFIVKARRGRNV